MTTYSFQTEEGGPLMTIEARDVEHAKRLIELEVRRYYTDDLGDSVEVDLHYDGQLVEHYEIDGLSEVL